MNSELYMELLEACRAAVAAQRRNEADPLVYVREVLASHGQLPPAGMTPAECLALAVAR
jgi:hypothetical protein